MILLPKLGHQRIEEVKGAPLMGFTDGSTGELVWGFPARFDQTRVPMLARLRKPGQNAPHASCVIETRPPESFLTSDDYVIVPDLSKDVDVEGDQFSIGGNQTALFLGKDRVQLLVHSSPGAQGIYLLDLASGTVSRRSNDRIAMFKHFQIGLPGPNDTVHWIFHA